MTGKVMTVCEANLRAAAFALAKEKGLLHKHADEQDSEGNTPVLRAMMQDEILNALTLIKAGADVNRRNFKDESPFDIARISPCLSANICICICMYIFNHIHIYAYVYIYVCVYIYIYIYIYAYVYIYVYVYVYIHTYIHTYICMQRGRGWSAS
jgi:hypothetical protein